ncbi:hypothetical protein GCM10009721_07870 [Terrabacter tumescens]|uniref:Uncharacterized protein n=1 Tax=Terrabacter tumescens TaxID=60443 RepID=A0ABQ2HNL0_9MICO|nr:DUF6236 family protein [Terrabacter tumescens]GGM85590.1 hypothetical protein GCM10009721_07870 [Terrabacter tumescens]
MLKQSGLYYPYIHIRKDSWLKASALYWKRVDRIVPQEYPTRDSLTARSLIDGLGFIQDRHPGQAALDTSRLFLDLLRDRGAELCARLRVQPSEFDLSESLHMPRDGGLSNRGTIGYIFAEKLTGDLIEALAAQGMAFGASGEMHGRRRVSLNYGSASWIGMDSRLAATYMTVLTRFTAEHFNLSPVTDEPVAHVAMEGLSVDAIASALIGDTPAQERDPRAQREQRVATLAIQSVLPRSLGSIGVGDIIRFRLEHESELGAFQAAVSAAGADLAALSPDVDPATLRQAVAEATEKFLLGPHNDLEKAMRLFGFDTLHSATTLQLPFTSTVGGYIALNTTPVLATPLAAIAVVGSALATEAQRRRSLRRQAGAANYLMELRAGLTPRGAAQRQIDRLGKHRL